MLDERAISKETYQTVPFAQGLWEHLS